MLRVRRVGLAAARCQCAGNAPGPAGTLRAPGLYRRGTRVLGCARAMGITVDGDPPGKGRTVASSAGHLVAVDYPIASVGAQGRPQADIVVTALKDDAVIYEMRMMTAPETVQPTT